VRLVVALASAAEISAAAAGAPNTQFLAVGVPDVQVGANVHSLNTSPSTLEERAFLAGYLLGMVIPDYRVGVISQAGTAEGQKTFDSFTVGARYFSIQRAPRLLTRQIRAIGRQRPICFWRTR